MREDYHNILENWEILKKIIEDSDKDIKKIVSSKSRIRASIRSRHNLSKIKKLATLLRKNILQQRQDDQSDYS
jgi:hypothetical protein